MVRDCCINRGLIYGLKHKFIFLKQSIQVISLKIVMHLLSTTVFGWLINIYFYFKSDRELKNWKKELKAKSGK